MLLIVELTVRSSNSCSLDGQSRSRRFFGLEYATVSPLIFIVLPDELLCMLLNPSLVFRSASIGEPGVEVSDGVCWECCRDSESGIVGWVGSWVVGVCWGN